MDVRGQRVLVFGDSLTARGSTEQVNVTEPPNRASSSPGDLLASWLLASGAQAARIDARVGRSAWNFWDREAAQQLLAADAAWKPTQAVVMLGTNDIGLSMVKDTIAMTRLRDAFRAMGAQVIAIGPPSFSRADLQQGSQAVVNMLQAVFGAGNVIDARPLSADLIGTRFRTSDQVHFTREGAAVLAQRLAGAVMRLGGVREKLAKLKPLGIGLGATLGLGLLGFGFLWISKRRTKLLSGALHGDDPLFNAEEFFYYLPDPPEDVEDEYGWKEPEDDQWDDVYPAKGSRNRTRWFGDKGHMVWLPWDQVHAMQGNQFDEGKIAALVEAIKRGGATLEPPIASISIVTKDDIRESQEAAAREELFDSYGTTRAYEEDDLGKITAQLRDGNHRAFAAQLAGEKGLWVYVPSDKIDNAKAALKKVKKKEWKAKLEGGKLEGAGATKRVAPGFYTGTYRGKTFELVKVEGSSNWYWRLPAEKEGGEDWFDSKRDALEAVRAWIDEKSPLDGVRPYDAAGFAERLREAKERPQFFESTARQIQATAEALARESKGWNRGQKVFIADVAERLGTTPERIAGVILVGANKGWLRAARADLTAAMDASKVAASEVENPQGDRIHFIDTTPEAPRDVVAPRRKLRGKVGGGR